MLNLLRGNISNQNFFYEGNVLLKEIISVCIEQIKVVSCYNVLGCYIQKLTPMFQIPSEIDDNPLGAWSPQKVSNVHCMVQVIRALVAPSGPAQVNKNISIFIYIPFVFDIDFYS